MKAGLEGRCAVVTGGGRGIGAAVARALAAEGCAVVVAARTAAEVESVASELREAGASAWAATCDVTDPADVDALAREAAERCGAVDVLVNNAGTSSSAALKDLELAEWRRLFEVNATGTYLCTRAFLPDMVERGWGRVVNVASVAGRTGGSYIAAYAAAKHAVLGFTRSVAAEAAPHGVTVNAVCPAYVRTEMTRTTIRRIVEKTGRSEAEALAAILEGMPLGRLVEPEEVAQAVVFLCSELAGAVNGEALTMDGGRLRA